MRASRLVIATDVTIEAAFVAGWNAALESIVEKRNLNISEMDHNERENGQVSWWCEGRT